MGRPAHAWPRRALPRIAPWLPEVVAVLLWASGWVATPAALAETVVIRGRAEVSARPSMDGPILAMLDDGERCEASAVHVAGAREGEEWVMVAAPPKAKVWISVGAVDLDAGKVRGEPAFLRAGPGVLSPAVGQAPRGMRVDVSDRLGLWLRIQSPPACVIGYVRAL